MENLIQVVNRLQDAFAKSGLSNTIDLPQIAVVGSQSAGKSSVLENCVGRDFLPRGAGIVTRRPLVLQLINYPEEYGEFLHKSGQKFYDFSQIRKEIEDETDRVTGTNKNISPMPINLRIFSPNVLNLTLVDLPGLTKVPVGDQPSDIGAQIRNMVCNFISNKNCLILAVTPANSDLANSDALLLAREVDPSGDRTIGIITKIDIMDQGTNCRDILLNLTYPLKRGYVGVVNRSQAGIDGKIDIAKAQSLEEDFFKRSMAYADIAHKCGTKYMQNVLFTQLAMHIKETLPTIKNYIQDKLTEVSNKLGVDDDNVMDTPGKKVAKMIVVVQNFCNNLEENLGFGSDIVNIAELSLGASINQILSERFPYEAKKVIPKAVELKKEIAIAIKNSQGVRSTIFTPDIAFTAICKNKIGMLKPITTIMMDKVMEQMRIMIQKSVDETLSSYPVLADSVNNFVKNSLSDGVKNAKDHMYRHIEIEQGFINTGHQDFVRIAFQTEPEKSGSDEEGKGNINTESTRVYRKGTLQMPTNSVFKSYKDAWFVIKGNQLICYRDETEKEIKFNIDVSNCIIHDAKVGEFSMQNKNGAPLMKDIKHITLKAANQDEAEDWKASLYMRGVRVESHQKSDNQSGSDNPYESNDSVMNRQVEYIRVLADSYLKIIITTHVDIATKIVMHHIIGKIRSDLRSVLQAYVYSLNIDEAMEEDVVQKEKRNLLINMRIACREALDIIGDVASTVNVRNVPADNYSLSNHSKAVENLKMETCPQSSTEYTISNTFIDKPSRPAPGQARASFRSTNPNLTPNRPGNAPSRPSRGNAPNRPIS